MNQNYFDISFGVIPRAGSLHSSFYLLFAAILFFFSNTALYGQSKGGKNNEIIVRTCVQPLGNGMYSASFSYENPSKKEQVIERQNSKVKLKNQQREFQGPHKFKPGLHKKVFKVTFSEKESVSWTIMTPSGNMKEVIASANSSKCLEDDGGFIFNVVGSNDKNTEKLGNFALAYALGEEGEDPLDFIFQIENGRLLVEVIPVAGQMGNLIQFLQSQFGLSFSAGDFIVDPGIVLSEGYGAVDCFLTREQLLILNDSELVNFAEVILTPFTLTNEPTGVAISEGVAAHKADIVRNSFGVVQNGRAEFVSGKGIGICAFSDTFDREEFTGELSKAQVSVINGDLPGSGNPYGRAQEVVVFKEGDPGGSDEGRAMLEIVHDMAPGAKLGFRTGTRSLRDFAQGIKELPPDITVAFDDITYPTESFEGTYSVVTAAIEEFLAQPSVSALSNESQADSELMLTSGERYYCSSAGNFGGKGFQGIFQPGVTLPDFGIPVNPGVRPHVFGVNDDGSENYFLPFTVDGPGLFMVVIQQNESFASFNNAQGAISDFDLVITDSSGSVEAVARFENGGKDPVEIFVFQAIQSGEAFMSVLVEDGVNFAGTPFRAIAFRAAGLNFSSGNVPTTSGHAAIEPVVTVGAVNQADAGGPKAQPFSSFGGVTSSSFNIIPDLAGYDGVATSVEGFSPFFGTSAAVPHIAGLIALLDPFLTALTATSSGDTVVSALENGDPLGEDPGVVELYQEFATGTGDLLQIGDGPPDALSTFDFLAARAPVAELQKDDLPEQPGAEEFLATLVVTNLNDSTTVSFGGQLLPILQRTENTLSFIIPEFVGNPPLVVENAAKSQSGIEVVTDTLFVLDEGKFAINIAADSLAVSYGQDIDLTATITGLPANETYEGTGLPEIVFTSAALDLLPYPDANKYLVIPGFATVPTEEQLDKYQVNFVSGLLTVERTDLTIGIEDATITRGEVPMLMNTYEIDPAGISDLDLFISTLRTAHESRYFEGNNYILINRLRTIVNTGEIKDFLENTSWMASENVFKNRLRTIVNGFNVIDLEPELFEDYFNNYDPETNRLRTIINRLRTIVNAKDLFEGRVEINFQNRLRTIVNESSIGGEEDEEDYTEVYAILDEEDAETEAVTEFFSANFISGLDVTTPESGPQVTLPGPLLAPNRVNFNVSYTQGALNILPSVLTVTTGDVFLEQGQLIGETAIDYTIDGFVYNETETDVFPEGVQFTLLDENGMAFQTGDTGCFEINIEAPENYLIENTAPGKLYINPTEGKKIRAFFDCVQLNTGADSDRYPFIANFRYENDNDFTLYATGENNFIEADGQFLNSLPVEFLPGEHFVRIPFDGQRLTWTLCTFGSCNPSSVTTDATLESNRCTARQIEDIETSLFSDSGKTLAGKSIELTEEIIESEEIRAFPNPVKDVLYVDPGKGALRSVLLYDITGKLMYQKVVPDTEGSVPLDIPMATLTKGMYFMEIITSDGKKNLKIVKD
ncbi:T9SS type A sorting domain-containing protein [Robertkochia marina]|uniref:T9SS type A sorting domain-containing protein n=1 Tax=Robertkochia marina TaxID=1227945 RepID=A0A4S3M0Z0_9FLAO|nr:T9SS type A sorting domain-containing protein [Robertkochia marina]THD68011.1 T9SS type A sorting domain-containing protein [Robertkochia marina]TRZ42703.1 T9SS C-terminal target domain-containing protein [Robertkochia marina]